MTNYADLSFSDEEVSTLYFSGIIDKSRELKKIYDYADRHLRPWVPKLPSYVAFVQRVIRVADVFAPIVELIQPEPVEGQQNCAWLTDSFPVALAKQGHRFGACVTKELADVGYCSTKKLYFYGFRVHVVARRQAGTLRCPEYLGVTEASSYDGKVFDQIRPLLTNNELYADKAYLRPDSKIVKAENRVSRC